MIMDRGDPQSMWIMPEAWSIRYVSVDMRLTILPLLHPSVSLPIVDNGFSFLFLVPFPFGRAFLYHLFSSSLPGSTLLGGGRM